jgi:DNA-binding GntR family transcriptional regulator
MATEIVGQRIFQGLGTATLRRQIADKIREAILDGSLRPGERLVERKLAAEFETSVTGVREALIELESDGFVIKKPSSATHVINLSADDAEQIFAVRRVLETFAVEEAARAATPKDSDDLERRYLELLDAARAGDNQLMIVKDIFLHTAIWQIPRNEYLYAALRRAALPIFAFSAIRVAQRHPIGLVQAATSHLPLIEAIKAKDPKAARDVFLASLDGWRSETRSHVFRGSEDQERAQVG